MKALRANFCGRSKAHCLYTDGCIPMTLQVGEQRTGLVLMRGFSHSFGLGRLSKRKLLNPSKPVWVLCDLQRNSELRLSGTSYSKQLLGSISVTSKRNTLHFSNMKTGMETRDGKVTLIHKILELNQLHICTVEIFPILTNINILETWSYFN